MGYVTGDEFAQRFDVRQVGDLVRDDGVQESPGSLPTNPILLECIADAAGEITCSLYVGNRYTVAQLQNLNDDAKSFLRRLNADMALVLLKRRRGKFNPEKDGALSDACDRKIKGLRDGTYMLLQVEAQNAPASTLTLDAPQLIPVLRQQTIRNQVGTHWYPERRDPRGPYPNQ